MFAAVERVPEQRALGTFLLVDCGCVTFHATLLSAMFMATSCMMSGTLLGVPKFTPRDSWPGTSVFSAFGIAPSAVPPPEIEQRYSKCVFGLYEEGCQSTPPSAAGAEARNVGPFFVYAYGVKMQPVMYGLPSGALPGHCFLVEHWFVNTSPTGYGWVFDRLAYFAAAPVNCFTFFSGMPRIGLPVTRFSR